MYVLSIPSWKALKMNVNREDGVECVVINSGLYANIECIGFISVLVQTEKGI